MIRLTSRKVDCVLLKYSCGNVRLGTTVGAQWRRWFSSSSESDGDVQYSHFRKTPTKHPLYEKPPPEHWKNPMNHPIWSKEDLSSLAYTHVAPKDNVATAAYTAIRVVRFFFDLFSGYSFGKVNEAKLLRRIVFLETVAGIPGMVAGSLRHLKSLRQMKRDHGWINTLLEEAENERMHMLCFLQLKQPSLFFRFNVAVAQLLMWNSFFCAYLISPRFCHSFVGYLEEEAVRTYLGAIEAVDDGRVKGWKTQPAPQLAIDYWNMPKDATMRDVLQVVCADEANHRDVNHTFSTMQQDDTNPFIHKHIVDGGNNNTTTSATKDN